MRIVLIFFYFFDCVEFQCELGLCIVFEVDFLDNYIMVNINNKDIFVFGQVYVIFLLKKVNLLELGVGIMIVKFIEVFCFYVFVYNKFKGYIYLDLFKD